jgi:hypothetical protein
VAWIGPGAVPSVSVVTDDRVSGNPGQVKQRRADHAGAVPAAGAVHQDRGPRAMARISAVTRAGPDARYSAHERR